MVSGDPSLSARFASIEARLDALEASLNDTDPSAANKKRSTAIDGAGKGEAKGMPSSSPSLSDQQQQLSIPTTSATPISPTQARLDAELLRLGFPRATFAFTRVPADYYDRPLEYRKSCLGAVSLNRLCKTLLLTNTRAKKRAKLSDEEERKLTPRQRAALSEHFLVIVQYESAKFDAERLKRALCERAAGAAPAKGFNLRLAADGAAEELAGYSHGGVTPVGARCGLLGSKGQVVVAGEQGGGGGGRKEGGSASAASSASSEPTSSSASSPTTTPTTEVPVVLSSRVARLPEFWMGAGEVDLKMCVSTREFIERYDPIVADVMHGDGEGGDDDDDEES